MYDSAMDIIPDTKDWTWVLERPCPECGLDTRQIRRENVPRLLREVSATWVAILEQREDVRTRPSPAVWSPLEYACHVRDVFGLYDHRLERMLLEEDPLFPNWDQDAAALAERYGEQDPARVAAQLHEAGELLAAHFQSVQDEQWQRPGRRSDGARFTVETFARYLIHDPIHHLYDVTGIRSYPGSEPQS
jgi:DinB superfamily